MDSIDRRLLELLTENGRATLTALAQTLSLSVPAVSRRVDRLERNGVIRGYTALIDPTAQEPATEALVEIFIHERAGRDEIRRLLTSLPEVRLALSVAGESDLVLLVRTRDTQHLEDLLVALRQSPTVMRTRSQVVLGRMLDREPH